MNRRVVALSRLLRGAREFQFAWLAQSRAHPLEENIYLVEPPPDGGDPVAAPPAAGRLPWPVLLTLACHSRKHIFIRNTLVKPGPLHDAVVDNAQRMKWWWHYHIGPNSSAHARADPAQPVPDPAAKRRKLSDRRPWKCYKQVAPELSWFSSELGEAVSRAVAKTNKAVVARRCQGLPGFVVFTKKWLEQHDMHALSSDKDGVFTLATGSVAKGLITEKLGSEAYAKILPADVEACSAAAVSAVRECAKTLRLAGLKWVSNEMLLPVEVKNRVACTRPVRRSRPISAQCLHALSIARAAMFRERLPHGRNKLCLPSARRSRGW